jgi:hypothetical protein
MLGKLFGEKQHHEALDPASPSARRLERDRAALEDFARRVHDRLELVPGDRATYVFIGRPPEAFGIAWFQGGEEHNFKRMMKDHGLSTAEVQRRSDELREAYARTRDDPRWETTLGGRKVLVHQSPMLERDVVEIIHRVEAE